MIFYILGLFLVGLLAGGLARLLVHSPHHLGCLGTAALGIIGSYAGGSLWSLLVYDKFDLRKASTFIGAVAGSVILLLLWRLIDRGRSRSRPR